MEGLGYFASRLTFREEFPNMASKPNTDPYTHNR